MGLRERSWKGLMVSRLNSIYFLIFHSSPSGPFLMAQSRPRLVVSRLRGRAVRTSVLRLIESGALSFLRHFAAGVGVPARYRLGRFV